MENQKGIQRLYRLEALRGLAAFYVVLHHTIDRGLVLNGFNVGIFLRFGQEAVILFFLLSGFVINYSFQKSGNKSFASYFFKRSTRIFIPLFFVFLVGYLTLSYNAGHFINPELWTLLKNILMLQDWEKAKPNVLAEPYMGNTPLWSLSYEWWFYMLYFPIATRINSVRTQAVFVFALSVVAAALYVYHPNFLFRVVAYLGIWWVGVYLSVLYMAGTHRLLKSYILPIGFLLALAAIMFIPVWVTKQAGEDLLLGFHPFLEFRHVVTSIIFVCGAIVWQKIRWIGFDVFLKPFLVLAPISYVLYICHLPLMVQATFLDSIDNNIVRWFCYMAIALVFSYLVELKVYPVIRDYLRARTIGAK